MKFKETATTTTTAKIWKQLIAADWDGIFFTVFASLCTVQDKMGKLLEDHPKISEKFM